MADSKIPSPGSKEYAAAQACLKSVADARAFAAAELGDDARWVNEPVNCDVAADEGCGSQMSGHELEFFVGKPGHCAKAALIPAYVYHEWAHGLNHEFADVRWQTLDEALADTFAIYLTGNPRFGQGMFLDREISWQRDLSDRKVYDGETKQVYTQSETLSGAWWEFRARLLTSHGAVDGAALAKSVFFQHLRELSHADQRPKLTDDYAFARQAVADLPALSSDAGRRAAVACALSNSFLDHGFDAAEPACARSALPTTDDEIAGLVAAPGARVVRATLAKSAGLPATIRGRSTLRYEFSVEAPRGARVRAVRIQAQVSHPFSEDLLLAVTAPDGHTRHELYKGEEELPVPHSFTDRYAFHGVGAGGTWAIELKDLGDSLEGEISSLSLDVLLR